MLIFGEHPTASRILENTLTKRWDVSNENGLLQNHESLQSPHRPATFLSHAPPLTGETSVSRLRVWHLPDFRGCGSSHCFSGVRWTMLRNISKQVVKSKKLTPKISDIHSEGGFPDWKVEMNYALTFRDKKCLRSWKNDSIGNHTAPKKFKKLRFLRIQSHGEVFYTSQE